MGRQAYDAVSVDDLDDEEDELRPPDNFQALRMQMDMRGGTC